MSSEYARMKRTTISMPDDLAAALEREAARRRVSVSQVARQFLEAGLGWNQEGSREISFAAIGSSEGPEYAADRTEEELKTLTDAIYSDAFGLDR